MWQPISIDELNLEIQKSLNLLNKELLNLWELIRVEPIKWQESVFGIEGNGFWAVALFGNNVLWYNDIEDGFNISPYQQYGFIAEYHANQCTLDLVLKRIKLCITDSHPFLYTRGAPQNLNKS
jgi:hypothetical protein